jgi:hypothetical protein
MSKPHLRVTGTKITTKGASRTTTRPSGPREKAANKALMSVFERAIGVPQWSCLAGKCPKVGLISYARNTRKSGYGLAGGGRSPLRTLLRGPAPGNTENNRDFPQIAAILVPRSLTRARFCGLFLHMRRESEQGTLDREQGPSTADLGRSSFRAAEQDCPAKARHSAQHGPRLSNSSRSCFVAIRSAVPNPSVKRS